MKKNRKNIILQSLASMLEEKNLSKITTASLAENLKLLKLPYIDIFQVKDLYTLNYFHFVTIQYFQNAMN